MSIAEIPDYVNLKNVYLGPECEIFLIHLPEPLKEKIKKKCLEFYVISCEEIQNRLPLYNNFLMEIQFIDPKIQNLMKQ